MTERMTISMPDELADRINSQLSWGDNRSELVRALLRDGLDARENEGEGDGQRQRIEAAVAELDWDETDAASHTAAREAAIADAVEVLAYAGVCSKRTVKRVVVESDRELGLKENSRERVAADLVQRVPGVRVAESDLFWDGE